MTLRLLINATNLRGGGVVQVATSVLDEIARLAPADLPRPMEIHVLACAAVDRNLNQLGCDTARFASYGVRDVQGFSRRDPVLDAAIAAADAVFTVFGPLYARRRPKVGVMGFAQPWIIYPENDLTAQWPWRKRLASRLKYALQARIMAGNTDHAVVEAPHVKARLVARGLFREEAVSVVPNCVSEVFRQPELWRPVDFPAAPDNPADGSPPPVRLGFLGRDYPHKNLGILPEARRLLAERHGIRAEIFLTLTPAEWQARPAEFRAAMANVGPLTLSQCPSFYRGLDAALFPSLLECFSVMPLEAMAMGRPLFASDRPFVRDICGELAHYFDPRSPESIADCLARRLKAGPPGPAEEAALRRQGFAGPGPRERALRYLEIVARTARDAG